jgi:hypothetical protein
VLFVFSVVNKSLKNFTTERTEALRATPRK